MSDPVIQVRGLTRYFGGKCAVDSLDIDVPRGCIFGFLGRNGSGKTTAVRMLLGLLEPTRGSCSILGRDSMALTPAVRERVGYLAEGHHVYGWMRVRECGRFQSRFYRHWNDRLFASILEYFQPGPGGAGREPLARGARRALPGADAGAGAGAAGAGRPGAGAGPGGAAGPAGGDGLGDAALRSHDLLLLAPAGGRRTRGRPDCGARPRPSDGGLRAETFRQRVRRLVVRFTGSVPDLAAVPGLLDSVRGEDEVAVTVAGAEGTAEEALHRLGAQRIEPVPIDLEEAFISYVGKRGSRSFGLPHAGAAS